MAAPIANSEKVLCDEILADGRRKSAEIVRKGREEAEATVSETTARAKTIREDILRAAQNEAARRAESILATIPLEKEKLRLNQMESLLEAIYQETKNSLKAREGFDYPKVLAHLASTAIARMSGDEFVLKLSPTDGETVGTLLIQQVKATGRPSLRVTVIDDATISDGGLIIEDLNGRQMWDNRLAERLKRMWPALRRQIADTDLCPARTAA